MCLCWLVSSLFAQPQFRDVSQQSNVRYSGFNSGIAIADFDRDGFEDVFVAAGQSEERLHRNQGNGRFQDVAQEAGLGQVGNAIAAAWADVDNDGWLDLYVGNAAEPNKLYRNLGNGRFEDISASAGVGNEGRTQAVLFADVDLDGWIDIYVANISAENALYRNNGDGTFTDIVDASGTSDLKIAMGSAFFDYDRDGDPDLYLTHDNRQDFILYQNDGQGRFTNVAQEAGVAYQGYGMGVDVGDVNRDGWLDMYITNLYENVLFLNKGDGTFENISQSAGIGDVGMGWGTTWLDIDNDGWQDIYVVNDTYFPVNGVYYKNIMYRNKGDNTFEIVSGSTSLESPYAGYGVASFDFDNDGRLDLFLANKQDDGNQLFRNETENDMHWVKVRCIGTRSNRAAIGARVEVEAGGVLWVDEISGGSGFASQNSLCLHFGLGEATLIDRLRVIWPGGETEEWTQLAVDRLHELTEGGLSTSTSAAWEKTGIQLTAPHPNPFESQSQFQLELSDQSQVSIVVTGIDGRQIHSLHKGQLSPGQHNFSWVGRLDNGQKLPVGLYLLHIRVDDKEQVLKIILQ